MKRRSARARITLVAGSEQRVIQGRMAVIYGELAIIEEVVNATPVGRIVVHYAHGQLKVEHTASLEAVRFDDDLDEPDGGTRVEPATGSAGTPAE